MNKTLLRLYSWILFGVYVTTAPAISFAQSDDDEDVFELNPFIVESDEDEGYRATATLAGTRVKTDLRDLAASVSVVTKEFLEDTGATDNTDLLVYTTNTEVGGQYGNFAGVGNSQGVGEQRNLTSPSTNTRVRGLEAADNTRNYFLTDIPWDGYNVDRVDLQRGPNSILFGVGSPSGIVNTTTIVPMFEDAIEYEIRVDHYGSLRNVFDYNKVLIDDTLAVRVALLHDDQEYKQEPAFEKDQRIFAAFTYTPDLFGEDAYTIITANVESGSIDANRPRQLTPTDRITPWWTGLNQQVFDPMLTRYANRIIGGNSNFAASNPDLNEPWIDNQMGGVIGGSVSFFFDNGVSTPSMVRQATPKAPFGIGPDGSFDASITSFGFAQAMSVAGLNQYSKNAEAVANALGLQNPYPSAQSNFYKDLHLTDPNIFDFYNILIDGHNKEETADWETANLSIAQTFFRNRIGIELVADYQSYESGAYSLLGWSPSLNIDINSHYNLIPPEYPGVVYPDPPDPATIVGGDPNPNAGRAFVAGNRPRSSLNETTRENFRATAFLELRGSDIFRDDSFLARLIGKNVFTGLLSRDERSMDQRQWLDFAMGTAWAANLGSNLYVDASDRDVGYVVYLSDDLRGVSSPWDLNLPGVQSVLNLSGNYGVTYFDSNWNAPTVDPAAEYIIPYNGQNNTQSENWQNYVGLSTFNANVLNAREGDRADLMTSVNKLDERLESHGVTWQGYWLDGMVVPTVGWRKDEFESWNTPPPLDPETQVRATDFQNVKTDENTDYTEGETVTWGVVGHTDRWLADKLPMGTNFSFFYNESENFRAVNRYGFSGERLPNPQGESVDYGVVLNTLDDRLVFKVTWYETNVKNARLDASTPLAGATWWAWNISKLGTAAAVKADLYWGAGEPIPHAQVNYGMVDNNKWGDPAYTGFPKAPEALNDPSNVKLFAAIDDWYATMLPQSFFDGWGIPIDTSKAAGGSLVSGNGSFDDINTMISGWNPRTQGNFGVPTTGGGRVNGQDPVIAIDNASEGIEFELQYRPVPNWNIAFNASKTKAYRENLGQSIRNFIEYQNERLQGPAGDLRVGWGGDQPLRNYFVPVYAAYEFQLDANGQSAAEIRPWRFNLISNYTFNDGKYRGLSIGGAVRWQDNVILGYGMNDELTKLDVNRPIHGGAETNIDLWAAYQKKLSDKLTWKIQVNVRNVGEDYGLIPVSVNPDGTPAAYRISQGMTWSVTNSFMF